MQGQTQYPTQVQAGPRRVNWGETIGGERNRVLRQAIEAHAQEAGIELQVNSTGPSPLQQVNYTMHYEWDLFRR
jgi:hypothetical protein